MKIHHLRNATFIIESGEYFILIDPMLGKKGSIPPFSRIKFKTKKNPLVDLPEGANDILNKVTHCLLTHSQALGIKVLQHLDHLDLAGEDFLRKKCIPIITPEKDKAYLEKYGMIVDLGLKNWETKDFLTGKLTAIPCQHGHGWVHKIMANGVGFFLQLSNEPSIFISGDTVLTEHVKKALTDLKPDISVLAAGQAQMDVGKPLLMSEQEMADFIDLAPGKVVANHMEALNHCPMDRSTLREILQKNNQVDKVLIPEDGECIEF